MKQLKIESKQTPAEFLSAYPRKLQLISEHARELVRSTFPTAHEEVYAGWKLIGYRLPSGKKSRYFCCIVPQRKENDVLLGFEYGIAMRDPKNLMEGKGTKVRFVRMQKQNQYVDDDLIWLIEEGARAALDLQ